MSAADTSSADAGVADTGAADTNPVGSILIAEDDRRVRASLERALRLEGYEVTAVADGAAALAAHDASRPDLLLLDVSMPNADGLSVCRMLRERGCDTQILMLTARHEVDDRVAGLDAGADDYLVKPFALEELLARVRARLRIAAHSQAEQSRSGHSRTGHPCGGQSRSGHHDQWSGQVRQVRRVRKVRQVASGTSIDRHGNVRLDDLEIDVKGRRVWRAGQLLHLSRTEFDLLLLLVTNAGLVLSRYTIYDEIWDGMIEVKSKTLDVYIGYLRHKTEIDDAPRLIHNVRGIGYVARIDAVGTD